MFVFALRIGVKSLQFWIPERGLLTQSLTAGAVRPTNDKLIRNEKIDQQGGRGNENFMGIGECIC